MNDYMAFDCVECMHQALPIKFHNLSPLGYTLAVNCIFGIKISNNISANGVTVSIGVHYNRIYLFPVAQCYFISFTA